MAMWRKEGLVVVVRRKGWKGWRCGRGKAGCRPVEKGRRPVAQAGSGREGGERKYAVVVILRA